MEFGGGTIVPSLPRQGGNSLRGQEDNTQLIEWLKGQRSEPTRAFSNFSPICFGRKDCRCGRAPATSAIEQLPVWGTGSPEFKSRHSDRATLRRNSSSRDGHPPPSNFPRLRSLGLVPRPNRQPAIPLRPVAGPQKFGTMPLPLPWRGKRDLPPLARVKKASKSTGSCRVETRLSAPPSAHWPKRRNSRQDGSPG